MGLISRIKTWVDNEKLNYNDLNSEFDNILTAVNGNLDNTNIDTSAGIVYSKLNLSNSVTDDDIITTSDVKAGTISFVIDGGGGVIQTGVRGDLEVPFNCTITACTLLADTTGSIVIDVWKDVYGSYPPTDADSITASAVPTISSATKSTDSTLTGWTTTVNAGDILRFNVDSCSTITRCVVSLKYRKV